MATNMRSPQGSGNPAKNYIRIDLDEIIPNVVKNPEEERAVAQMATTFITSTLSDIAALGQGSPTDSEMDDIMANSIRAAFNIRNMVSVVAKQVPPEHDN